MELIAYLGISSAVVGVYGLVSGEIPLGMGFLVTGVTLFLLFRRKGGA